MSTGAVSMLNTFLNLKKIKIKKKAFYGIVLPKKKLNHYCDNNNLKHEQIKDLKNTC